MNEESTEKVLSEALVGHKVISASIDNTVGTLGLDNGTTLLIDAYTYDCCSWQELTTLTTVNNVITAVRVEDNEYLTGDEGPYKAWVTVVTEADEYRLAEADADASNGYYLHGWCLNVTVTKGGESDE